MLGRSCENSCGESFGNLTVTSGRTSVWHCASNRGRRAATLRGRSADLLTQVDGLGSPACVTTPGRRFFGDALLRKPVVDRSPNLFALENTVPLLDRLQSFGLSIIDPKRVLTPRAHVIQCMDVGWYCQSAIALDDRFDASVDPRNDFATVYD